jgi:hypothetical protein
MADVVAALGVTAVMVMWHSLGDGAVRLGGVRQGAGGRAGDGRLCERDSAEGEAENRSCDDALDRGRPILP